jgi:hypothetical protein
VNDTPTKQVLVAALRHLWVVIVAPIIVGIIVIVVVAVWHPWDRAKPPLRRTAIRLLAANEPATGLSQPVAVTGNSEGICQVPSQADPSPNAFRCMGGNYIYDPCFGDYDGSLVCIGTPWSTTGLRFKVTDFIFYLPSGKVAQWNPHSNRPIPEGRIAYGTPGALSKQQPWALELANGLRCLYVEGASFEIAGERADYGCFRYGTRITGGGPWVIGPPDRSDEPWVVSILPKQGRAQTTEEAVRVAWY